MNRLTPLLVAIAGSLLLWASWPVSSLTYLIFISWTPLLWIEANSKSWKKFFLLTYLHMLLWNVLVTWWVWNASLPGALGAFFANSLIMCLPWLLFYFTKRQMGNWVGYGSLILYWVCFEYIHHNWELSWPWLTLGNALSLQPKMIQWYEYTGTTGGTIWILASNITAFLVYKTYRREQRSKKYFQRMISFLALLFIPVIVSIFILKRESRKVAEAFQQATSNVVVVQPNIDPYTEKFTGAVEEQLHKIIQLSEKQVDANTALVVWPETAVPVSVEEGAIKNNRFYYPIWDFLQRHPQINLLTGINSFKIYGTDKKEASNTARFDAASGIYYDEFNTAAFFDADTNAVFYHKAKLVPGVETLPSFLNFMSSWFEDLGGISGTLGRDNQRKVFVTKKHTLQAAPVICYESIYSDYITDYIRKGANLLTIITNDGWWGNTPGYKQHMNYGRLRAIETRKWVARSANTGISCFIDPTGDVINPQPWNTAAAIKINIPVNNEQTFYVRYGDIFSRAATVVSILLILIVSFIGIRKKIIQK